MKYIEVALGMVIREVPYTNAKTTAQTPHTATSSNLVYTKEVLAAQRSYGPFKGLWEFPGGKLNKGETPQQACMRELQEELNIVVTDLVLLTTIKHSYSEQDLHVCLYCFMCHTAMQPINKEHIKLAWLDAQSLDDVAWPEANQELVAELKQALR